MPGKRAKRKGLPSQEENTSGEGDGSALGAIGRKIGNLLLPLAPMGRFTARWAKKIDSVLSPRFLTPPASVIFFVLMFLTSSFVIALETIQFHALLVVADYVKATFIISIAMLGIAIGGFLAFTLGRINTYVTMFFASILLFFSVILSYYNLINIAVLGFPYFMILPFIFASFIISSIFAKGNSNIIYFTNLVASGLGVILPLIMIPLFKSETSLIVLMAVPVAVVFFLSLRIANLIPKAVIAALSVVAMVQLLGFVGQNLAFPDRISRDVFEKKILPEMAPIDKKNFVSNYTTAFLGRVYSLDAQTHTYNFASDAYDRKRAIYFLQVLGFVNRFSIPFVDKLENHSMVADPLHIPQAIFDSEIMPAAKLRYDQTFVLNNDMIFLSTQYKLVDGAYVLSPDRYQREHAKLLLGELGHVPFYDITLDLRKNGYYADAMKMYSFSTRYVLSEDSTLGRVEYSSNDDSVNMAIDGALLDNMDRFNGTFWDPRVPHLENPKVFIVGLSADGIAKSVKRLPGARVYGVEINPIIWKTMTDGGIYEEAAAHPYRNVTASLSEARSTLENSSEQFDLITLMDIHAGYGPSATLSPENFHTVEATRMMLKKLTDRGVLDYEEIILNKRSDMAFLKILNTIKEGLRQSGVANPEACFYVWKWDFWGGDAFRTVLVKKTPFTKQEIAGFDAWVEGCKATGNYTGIGPLYSPFQSYGNKVETILRTNGMYSMTQLPTNVGSQAMTTQILDKVSDPRDKDFVLRQFSFSGGRFWLSDSQLSATDRQRMTNVLTRAGYPIDFDLSPITDNSPFPFNVYKNKTEVTDMLSVIFKLSLFLLIPLLILLLQGIGKYKLTLVSPVAFTAVTGFGYMLIEIVLIQKFQLFIGDPTMTLVVILGGMLVFSGIGSFVSYFFPRYVTTILTALIPVLLLIYMGHLDGWFHGLGTLSTTAKLWASAGIIFPLTFLMGMPFPNALEVIKQKTSAEFGSLMFGVSGVFSTIGSTTGILINVTGGYSQSFSIGTICYSIGLVFFIYLMLRAGKKAAA